MMKRIFYLIIILLASANTLAQSLNIFESAGWLESVYVKWIPIDDAKSYNVYFSGEGIADKKIDNQLIRNYGTYYRADILGLRAGTYTIKVVPVISGMEGEGTVTGSLVAEVYDRNGFAFSNGRIPGAYKADGTQKDNAVIIYITKNTINTVSINVTGANENPCVGLQAILDGFKKGQDTRPLIVRMVGQITDPGYMLGGDIVIENANNASSYITMEGVGDDAVADGWGIRIKNASNIEIRNIGTMNCNSQEGDNIGLQQENDYIWIHNCDFFYGMAGSDADQIKGDGALDCKRSTYVTFSYNHFWDSGKTNLLGLGEGTTSGLFITYHHNWYDHSDSRHPRVRYYSAHVYNNYYDGNAKYGAGSTMGSSVFVEANYFRNCKYPMLTSMQGTDVFDETTQANNYTDIPIFSKEDGGTIKAFNNFITGQHRFVPYGASGYPNPTVDFDAYVATSRNEIVGSSVVSFQGGNAYNNFDTNPSFMYDYTPDSPEDAKTKVTKYAGRVTGGDFKWTFNNSLDDASYDVNTAMKASLTSYKTSLINIQGDSAATVIVDTVGTTPADMIQNFTLSGKTSTFYTITGNLSLIYGSVSYAGLTLTQCLKIESSTNITFTTTETGTLTLVFNSAYSGSVKIDGITYTPSAGIIGVTILAGPHTIIKGSGSSYLFYMIVEYSVTGIEGTNAARLKIYPNPVENYLSVSSGIEVEMIDIYSLAGVLVQRKKGNVKTLDMSNMSNGCYLIRVHTRQGMFTQMVIKK
jgi:pectate lyase